MEGSDELYQNSRLLKLYFPRYDFFALLPHAIKSVTNRDREIDRYV